MSPRGEKTWVMFWLKGELPEDLQSIAKVPNPQLLM